MFQTKILGNFFQAKTDEYINEFIPIIDALKLQGKTDGILTYDPPLEQNALTRYYIRTWIDLPAAEEWITLRTAICVKHGIDHETYSITEIV